MSIVDLFVILLFVQKCLACMYECAACGCSLPAEARTEHQVSCDWNLQGLCATM